MAGQTRGVGLVYRQNRRNVPLWVTVVDDGADERVRGLLDQYPALESVCRFVESSISVRDSAPTGRNASRCGSAPDNVRLRERISRRRRDRGRAHVASRPRCEGPDGRRVGADGRGSPAPHRCGGQWRAGERQACSRLWNARARPNSPRAAHSRGSRSPSTVVGAQANSPQAKRRRRGPNWTRRARSPIELRPATCQSSCAASAAPSFRCTTFVHQHSSSPMRSSRCSRSPSTSVG